MTSGAASPSPGASQAPRSAPLVEHAQERRQALDGEWYTREQFKWFYQKPHRRSSVWQWYWDQAKRGAVLPGASQPGSSEVAGRSPAEPDAVEFCGLMSDRAPAAEVGAAPAALGASTAAHAAEPAAAPAAFAAEPVAAPAAPGDLQPGPLSPGDLQLALVPTVW